MIWYRYLYARSLLQFISVFLLLEFAWERSRGTAIERVVIDHVTVVPAAWWLNRLWPEQVVSAVGHSLVASTARLNILNGCEGLEIYFLLAAAFLSYPLSIGRRVLGIGGGALLIYILNQLRILALWQVQRTQPDLFGWLHGMIFPLLFLAISFVFFLSFLPQKAENQL